MGRQWDSHCPGDREDVGAWTPSYPCRECFSLSWSPTGDCRKQQGCTGPWSFPLKPLLRSADPAPPAQAAPESGWALTTRFRISVGRAKAHTTTAEVFDFRRGTA